MSNARLHILLAVGFTHTTRSTGKRARRRRRATRRREGEKERETERRQLIDAAARCSVVWRDAAHRDVAVSTIAATNAAMRYVAILSRTILNVMFADNAPRKISSRFSFGKSRVVSRRRRRR